MRVVIDDTPEILTDISKFRKPYWVEVGSGGYGREPFDEWIHCDPHVPPAHHIEVKCYAWRLPLENGSVKKIYGQGMWEHLSYAQCDKAMAEWIRVLRPGGIIEFNFPPIDHYIDRYNDGRADWIFLRNAIWGWQKFHEDIHLSGWTASTMLGFLDKYKDVFEDIRVFPAYHITPGEIMEVDSYDAWDNGVHGWVRLLIKG